MQITWPRFEIRSGTRCLRPLGEVSLVLFSTLIAGDVFSKVADLSPIHIDGTKPDLNIG